MKKIMFIVLIFMVANLCPAQVGIGTNAPKSSAILDVNSSSKGMLLPRMNTVQRKAIASPAQGLLVYDVDKGAIFLFDGVKWLPMLFAGDENQVPPVNREASDNSINSFGISVAVDGNYAVIGAADDSPEGLFHKGAAYVFFNNGGSWQQQAKISSSDGISGDAFGYSVGISGDYIIAGTYHQAIGGGPVHSAYIFSRSGSNWTELAKLTATDGIAGDYFGFSVGINGDYAVVGAYNKKNNLVTGQGSAYIFYKGNAWTTGQQPQAKLLAPDGASGDYFGYSVSISGSFVIVGAPSDDAEYINQGAAYIFGRVGSNWPFLAKIKGVPATGAWFGKSVCINGDYAIAGAPYENIIQYATNYQGSAYVFNGSLGWNTDMPSIQLSDPEPNPANNSRFGQSVNLKGDYALVGASMYGTGDLEHRGTSWLYKRNGTGWPVARKIADANSQANSLFGWSVGVGGFNVIIGAPGKNNGKGDVSFLNVE
jgi:hypothetical protein